MQKIVVSVEANLNDKRARLRAEKKVVIKEEACTSDQLLRKVENFSKGSHLISPNRRSEIPIFVVNSNHNSGSNNESSEHKNQQYNSR